MSSDRTVNYNLQYKSKGCLTYKKILTFIVLEVIVILVTTGIVFYMKYGADSCEKRSSRKIDSPLTYSKVFGGSFSAKGFNGTWISDTEIFMQNSAKEYVIYDIAKRTEMKIVTNKTLIDTSSSPGLSADRKYLHFPFDYKHGYRWSSNYSVLIYNVETRAQRVIQDSTGKPLSLQLFQWDPVVNGFSYVYSNNIYYRPNASADEEYQITTDGSSTIFNGICDWVYEEEIFSGSSAFWYAPNGKRLAYASLNDTAVDIMPVTYYGKAKSMEFQYPKLHNLHYPKAGRPNPTMQLYVVDLDRNSSISRREIKVPVIFREQILSSLTWINDTALAFIIMNRVQNKAAVLVSDSATGQCNLILSLENNKGWIEKINPMFSNDGENMLFIHFWDQGNNLGAYEHLTMYNIPEKKFIPLTRGKFSVTEISAWDIKNNVVYFAATQENKAMNQQIYKVKIDEAVLGEPYCLSCASDDKCHFWRAYFSKLQSHHTLTCSGPSVPYVKIFDSNNKEIYSWEENMAVHKNIMDIPLHKRQFLKFPVQSDLEVDVELHIPRTIDLSGKKTYPLLIYVYGGPNSRSVRDIFKISWSMYFSINYETILATIDGRGTGLNGDKILFANYRQLGGAEIEDQLDVTRQLQEKFPFIDKTRTGIWGHSYGGYVSGMVMAKDQKNIFKCGASVAPVTDWIYYDTMYTERYMGLPTEEDNLAGYLSSSLLNANITKKQFEQKKYLLVHGTNDDNVHFQHSMILARYLQKNDVTFSQMVYPDEAHSLSGVTDHFFHGLESFFSDCFA